MDVFTAFAKLDRSGKKKLARKIQLDCASYPAELVQIPIIPAMTQEGIQSPIEIWKSRGFVVQVFDFNSQWYHLKINRNAFTLQYDRFLDGITWERLMQLKHEIGRGDLEAVELFPADQDSLDSKLRHLFVRKSGSIIEELGIGWKAHAEILRPVFSVDQSSIDPTLSLMGIAQSAVLTAIETQDHALAAG